MLNTKNWTDIGILPTKHRQRKMLAFTLVLTHTYTGAHTKAHIYRKYTQSETHTRQDLAIPINSCLTVHVISKL